MSYPLLHSLTLLSLFVFAELMPAAGAAQAPATEAVPPAPPTPDSGPGSVVEIVQQYGEELRTYPVANNIYMLEGKGGNIGVCAGSEGFLLVDDSYSSEAKKVRSALAALGTGPVKYIVNTHWHRDHTEGNQVFGAEAHIIAQAAVRPRLQQEGYPEAALPDESYDSVKELKCNGEEIRLIHASDAHTDGDSIVYFATSKVLHLGDLFFCGRLPFIDIDHGGSVEGYLEDLRELINQLPEDVLIIPGHGPLADIDDLRDFYRMLADTINFVQQQQREALPLERVLAGGLPSPWDTWAWEQVTPERYLENLYKGLAKGFAAAPKKSPQDQLPDQLMR